MTGDPDEREAGGEPPARPLLNLVFWLALLAGLLCIVGGGAVALYGPRLFPAHAKPIAAPHP